MLRGSTVVAIRRLQTSILARHQRKLKPSSELLQTLPDVYEVLESGHASYRIPCVYQSGYFFPPHWQVRSYSTHRSPISQNIDEIQSSECKTTAECVSEDDQGCVSSEENDLNADEVSERIKRLEDAKLIIDMWRKTGKMVPDEISDDDLERFALLNSKNGRKKFIYFLANKEVQQKMKKIDQQRKAEERAKQAKDKKYEKFDKNTIFMYIRQSSMVNADMWNLARGMRFGPDLVMDMDYEHEMNHREVVAVVKQLTEVVGAMKPHWEPFHMHWTNIKPGGAIEREMQRVFKDHLEKLVIDITHKPFLELFPRDKLVYLSPESPNVLTHYDPEKVYIIGGLVDLSIKKGLSFAKVKRHNLESARLPLDHFVKWGVGSKNLTLDQMVHIMLNIKETNDWQQALKHVPVRKIQGMYEQSPGDRYRDRNSSYRASPQISMTGDFAFSRASRPGRQEDRSDTNNPHKEQAWYARTSSPYEQKRSTQTDKVLIGNMDNLIEPAPLRQVDRKRGSGNRRLKYRKKF
ncbi:tRNA methyltransferase 10 homolog C-like [Glandiceps talaboti]